MALVIACVQAVAREDEGRGAPVALEAPEGPARAGAGAWRGGAPTLSLLPGRVLGFTQECVLRNSESNSALHPAYVHLTRKVRFRLLGAFE